MGFVLDASVALAWCFADEATTASQVLLERLESETATVPAIWSLEVGNVLLQAVRRQRLAYAESVQFLEFLEHLPIEVDPYSTLIPSREIMQLAYNNQLTTYDAAYLDVALRSGLPLATKDQQLTKAATLLGVSMVFMPLSLGT